MSDKAHITYFNMGPWPAYCGFTQSREAFAREMKRLAVKQPVNFLGSDHANATAHYFEKDGEFTVIITMEKAKGRSIEQICGLIAHEAVHVAQELWRTIGEKSPGDEAEAYLVQHIVQCCMQEALDTGRERKGAP